VHNCQLLCKVSAPHVSFDICHAFHQISDSHWTPPEEVGNTRNASSQRSKIVDGVSFSMSQSGVSQYQVNIRRVVLSDPEVPYHTHTTVGMSGGG